MKHIYKMLIACVITAIVTATATVYIMSHQFIEIETLCKNDASPDLNGCCPGEEYTDMGDQGFNCCPIDGGDCFPPLKP